MSNKVRCKAPRNVPKLLSVPSVLKVVRSLESCLFNNFDGVTCTPVYPVRSGKQNRANWRCNSDVSIDFASFNLLLGRHPFEALRIADIKLSFKTFQGWVGLCLDKARHGMTRISAQHPQCRKSTKDIVAEVGYDVICIKSKKFLM